MNFDKFKNCDANEYSKLFKNCIYCDRFCNQVVDYNNFIPYKISIDCMFCNFHTRYENSYVDFTYKLDKIKMILILADYAGVYLMKKNTILKIISNKPITDLFQLRSIANKYGILV
jgi:hypothetical protein